MSDTLYTYSDFISSFKIKKPDMILLDLMLPDKDGFDILKEIRDDKDNDDIDIIIVSAKNQTIDKIDGFDLGADDYIEKPFDILELISRVNAKYRRKHHKNEIKVNGIKVDENNHKVYVDDKEIKLTTSEYTVFLILLKNKDEVVSRDKLLEAVWGNNEAYETRIIDAHIKSIRDKIGSYSKNLQSVYARGYIYKDE